MSAVIETVGVVNVAVSEAAPSTVILLEGVNTTVSDADPSTVILLEGVNVRVSSGASTTKVPDTLSLLNVTESVADITASIVTLSVVNVRVSEADPSTVILLEDVNVTVSEADPSTVILLEGVNVRGSSGASPTKVPDTLWLLNVGESVADITGSIVA